MAGLKTVPTDGDVQAFLASVPDERRRLDAQEVCQLMQEVTGEQPVMWGDSMVGFGSYRYENRSKGGEWFVVGFAPRKQSLTIYLMDGFDRHGAHLAALGPHTTAKSCLYVKDLTKLDRDVLRDLIAASVDQTRSSDLGPA
jgi:hypothetical protein